MKKEYLDHNPPTRDKIPIILNEDDFKALVNGKIIATEHNLIALKDIGYHRMQLAVTNAIYQSQKRS